MLELKNNELVFRFPEVHPNAELRLNLQRTLRIPDDGKSYPLPPGLGCFPTLHVDDYKDRVPSHWREHGGVFVPMYASEALWIAFLKPAGLGVPYPFAVRVAAGKINAVSGDGWSDVMTPGDHLVTPPQLWLDGFAVEKGKIRQFVAAPLGSGLTVEQQLTGREEHGGIQIEVRPLKAIEYEQLLGRHREEVRRREAELLARGPARAGGILRGMVGAQSLGGYVPSSSSLSGSNQLYGSSGQYGATPPSMSLNDACEAATNSLMADMGLGAGGLMTQQVYEDTFGIDAWDSARSRVFLHLANSLAWEAITGLVPPPSPCTVEEYTRKGFPWFDHYVDGAPVAAGGKNLQTLQTVKQMADAKGLPFLPTNTSVDVPAEKVVKLGSKSAVRDGSW